MEWGCLLLCLLAQLRATYRAYDAVDEVTSAYSVAFDLDGAR
jgi:hypothetical protein